MLTPYPQIVEYSEAVQHPLTSFRDPELQQGRVQLNSLGLPLALSGGFALTYPMTTPRRRLALRCFHRDIVSGEHKYAAIGRTVKPLNSPYFVDFTYLADGIRIRGGYYPVLKMEWAAGDPLDTWLEKHVRQRRRVARLREAFAALANYLEAQGIAHGDIQNGNVLISRHRLKLVDYDGMYVPGMPREYGCESGHRHFQHPHRTAADFGPTIDRFSLIAVDLSLAGLTEDPSLYRRFCQGGETILFRAIDFAAPERSEVFGLLGQIPALRPAVENFAAICRADFGEVPTLAEFRAGRNIPRQNAAAHAAAHVEVKPPISGGSNRKIVAQLLGGGGPQEPAPVPRRVPARVAPAPPERSNRAILAALARQTAAPPLSATAASGRAAPQLVTRPAVQPLRPAASPQWKPIPKTGSFIIHPRSPALPPSSGLPPAAAAESLWDRVRRFLGIAS